MAAPRSDEPELAALLAVEPGLCAALHAGLSSRRWMMTIHVKVADTPPDDFRHHLFHLGFPIAEMARVLDHVKTTMLPGAGVRAPAAKDWR